MEICIPVLFLQPSCSFALALCTQFFLHNQRTCQLLQAQGLLKCYHLKPVMDKKKQQHNTITFGDLVCQYIQNFDRLTVDQLAG